MIGLHKYEVIETKEIHNPYNISVGNAVISKCKNCGKIKVTNVFTNLEYIR